MTYSQRANSVYFFCTRDVLFLSVLHSLSSDDEDYRQASETITLVVFQVLFLSDPSVSMTLLGSE